jgi:hypothetical protein
VSPASTTETTTEDEVARRDNSDGRAAGHMVLANLELGIESRRQRRVASGWQWWLQLGRRNRSIGFEEAPAASL